MKALPPLTPAQDAALTARAEGWLDTPDAEKYRIPRDAALAKRILDVHTSRMDDYRAWCNMLADRRNLLAVQSDLTTLELPIGSLTEERAQIALLAVREKLSARILQEGHGHAPLQGRAESSAQPVLVTFSESKREND